MAETLNINLAVIDNATAPMKNAQRQVQAFSNQTNKAGQAMNNFGKQATGATRLTKKFAMSGVQQAGYQVGDFFVQVGAGTSKLQAFGQQGSQLLGIFGPLGAVAGAGVAIFAALANAANKAKGEIKSLNVEADELNSIMSQAITFGSTNKQVVERLEKKYGTLTQSVINLANAEKFLLQVKLRQGFVQTTEALSNLTARAHEARASFGEIMTGLLSMGRVQPGINNRMKELEKTFGLTADNVGILQAALPQVLGKDMAVAAEAANRVLNEIKYDETITKTGMDIIETLKIIARLGLEIPKFDPLPDVEEIEAVKNATKGFGAMLNLAKDDSDALAKSMSASFGSAVTDIIKGTTSIGDAFRSMAAQIVDQLIQVLIIQRIVGNVGGTAANGQVIKGSGLAGVLSGTLATGGPVTTGKTYLVGERGPELFTAGSNGRIIPNNQMQGGATVVQNINISTGVSQTVRAEIAQLMPQIANSAKAAVLDAKQRGGTFSKAF